MNIHIELVKKWLADNGSVSQQELKDNRDAAWAACAAACHAYHAAHYAAAHYADDADRWVERYEELTK